MKLGIMQPYIFPYIGYFQLINAVDRYVIYDDVNYIHGGWINRNNILVNNQQHMFTIKLDHCTQNKHINELTIADDFESLSKTIFLAYKRAPFFESTFQLFKEIVSFPERNLASFVSNSIIRVSKYLGIGTEFIMSSKIRKDNALKNDQKIMHICDLMSADTYVNAIGGQLLYNKQDFERRHIRLQFLKSHCTEYKQFRNIFIPCLSILDVMMFNSPDEIQLLLKLCELI
jgi:hypothetical protein